jgi:creatinine amidohydrolase
VIQDEGIQPEGASFQTDMLQGTAASRVFDFNELTSSGMFGKPSLASKDKGECFFNTE